MQEISELHQAARDYAACGIKVFPVEINGKKPVTAHGYLDATTDIKQIDEWWGEHDYNIAFSPESARLFVVDVDPGGTINGNLPATYRVKTPRGSHFYFSGSGPSTAGKLGPHIDTRGVGGYVLLPPSRIDEQRYEIADDLPYAELPVWISDALRAPDTAVAAAVDEQDLPANIDRARLLLSQCVDRGDVAIEGQGGDDRTYRLCCELLDLGLSANTARDLLEEIWNPHCQPPWETYDIDLKLDNASRYQQNDPGAYGTVSPQQAFGEAIKHLLDSSVENKHSRFYFKDETEQDAEPDPQWLVKDLITERSTVLLFGATQSYKSFLALDIVLSLATGKETFGAAPLQGPVFYAALEGRAHLKKARKSWRVAREIEGKIKDFYVGVAPLIGVPGEIQDFGDEIARRCAGRKPRLIVIDTLGKAMAGLNENDAMDAGKFIRFCDSLVESFGCSVIAIHHTGKDDTRGARGSSAFHAGFDTVIEVKAHRATKAVSVWARKHKDAEEREIPWTFEGRAIAGSLAFFPTDLEAHKALTGDKGTLTPKQIGAALQVLNAYGVEQGVSTAVLATELTPAIEGQSVEDRQIAISRTGRALAAKAKDHLEAYCVKTGKALVWMLPAPVRK